MDNTINTYATTIPKNMDAATGQYYFTPLQYMDDTINMTTRVSYYSSAILAHHTATKNYVTY